MEISVINIPGTNMARHMNGSREMLTLNRQPDISLANWVY